MYLVVYFNTLAYFLLSSFVHVHHGLPQSPPLVSKSIKSSTNGLFDIVSSTTIKTTAFDKNSETTFDSPSSSSKSAILHGGNNPASIDKLHGVSESPHTSQASLPSLSSLDISSHTLSSDPLSSFTSAAISPLVSSPSLSSSTSLTLSPNTSSSSFVNIPNSTTFGQLNQPSFRDHLTLSPIESYWWSPPKHFNQYASSSLSPSSSSSSSPSQLPYSSLPYSSIRSANLLVTQQQANSKRVHIVPAQHNASSGPSAKLVLLHSEHLANSNIHKQSSNHQELGSSAAAESVPANKQVLSTMMMAESSYDDHPPQAHYHHTAYEPSSIDHASFHPSLPSTSASPSDISQILFSNVSGQIVLLPTSDVVSSTDPNCSNLLLNLCNLRHSLSWTIVLFIAYLIVFFIGLFGNLSVLWIVYMLKGETKRRHSCMVTSAANYGAGAGIGGAGPGGGTVGGGGLCHTTSNNSSYYCQHHYTTVPVININRSNVVFYRFVCNLALADLLVVLFCLPPTLIGNIYLPWVLGRLVCKAVPYLQGVSVNASVYTLVAISIDRFYAIYYPLSKKCSTALCWCTILLIWALSFVISFPWLVYFEVIPVNGSDYPALNNGQAFQVCRDIWPSMEMEKAHFLIVNLGLQYLIPLSVIALFYILILKKIAERKLPKLARHLPSNVKDGNRQSSLVIERSKVKVFKMLIVLVLLFALSWLPLYMIFFIIKIGPRFDDHSVASQILDTSVPVAQWLGASNSCVNPILYFFFNAKFRSYYRNSWLKTFSCLSVIRPSMASRDDKSTVTAV